MGDGRCTVHVPVSPPLVGKGSSASRSKLRIRCAVYGESATRALAGKTWAGDGDLTYNLMAAWCLMVAAGAGPKLPAWPMWEMLTRVYCRPGGHSHLCHENKKMHTRHHIGENVSLQTRRSSRDWICWLWRPSVFQSEMSSARKIVVS
jgi:hypothetical protein